MSTTNVSIGTAYTKIAEDTDSTLLASCSDSALPVQYAATDTDVAPSADLQGHQLNHNEAITRPVIGAGFVWARCQYGTVVLVVTAGA